MSRQPLGDGPAEPAEEDGVASGISKEIEEIRADAREQIEKFRQETREVSAEINRKRQEHMQRMLELQKQKEELEGEVTSPHAQMVGVPHSRVASPHPDPCTL